MQALCKAFPATEMYYRSCAKQTPAALLACNTKPLFILYRGLRIHHHHLAKHLYTIKVQNALRKYSGYMLLSTNTERVQGMQVSHSASLEYQHKNQVTRPKQAGSFIQAQSAWQARQGQELIS